ncbi:GDP/UDP-N,N'-diacetylbacillosamine 2-epimerase (hydrolysing) [Nonlabens dokdonensis]|uniref:GDP/UDP-N,N'-diacetylbacillosamine 2-epimerase (Hydrolysing) n=2 Tax=Nonlabens dokdonensis TaxID=328515 RepID=A0ABX5PWX6_9FLAO|nr:UDP-N-acetylglucosamine 2-epimerase [Nonlabens dokdonensis]AGC78680.1 putative UDP-N-acetylglucosamine 2-epimerase [Nonlabens dokdonensis DSW-6]PZX39193.1 GDP/UDP-N,N'-diacetylbacillosamine 2-epimerase (hydrolysing) [Nonlabens dokdonensis]
MKIAVLTSSRADYGIYFPLLEKIKNDSFFDLEVICFGTHCSKAHGYTLSKVKSHGYKKIHEISALIANDNAVSISSSYGLTTLKFAEFWEHNHEYEMVFCLGDRFEMSAAVQAGIPFGIKFVHLYGGDTTLGAIDDIYRNQITLASFLHFTATEDHSKKIQKITNQVENIFTIGTISLNEIASFKPVSKKDLLTEYNIPVDDYVLVTFHPETIATEENELYAEEMKVSLLKIAESSNVVVTMPNADTMGSLYRDKLFETRSNKPDKIFLVENFGKKNYFSAMYHAKLLIGNTSSGIVEAASFGKLTVNVGDRQKGRAQSDNVLNATFNSVDILDKYNEAVKRGTYYGDNVYYRHNSVESIIRILKKYKNN